MDIVNLGKVQKDLKKVPKHIKSRLIVWGEKIRNYGVREVRKIKGYHDEPLKGKRKGQRYIRLSRHWRAIYREEKDGTINIVEEINKHKY